MMCQKVRKYITDNSGLRYYLEVVEDSQDLFWVELWRKGEWVGYVKYQTDPFNIIIAGDIYIRDDSNPPKNSSVIGGYSNLPERLKKSIIISIPTSKKDIKNYRHQGLGTKLLNLLIKHAKKKKVQHIYGSVMRDDIDKTPGLVEWYDRHGFKRCGRYQGCVENAAAWIFMDLT